MKKDKAIDEIQALVDSARATYEYAMRQAASRARPLIASGKASESDVMDVLLHAWSLPDDLGAYYKDLEDQAAVKTQPEDAEEPDAEPHEKAKRRRAVPLLVRHAARKK